MPRKRKKTVFEGNLEYMMGSKKARLRKSDGTFASDPIQKMFGKKKKKL